MEMFQPTLFDQPQDMETIIFNIGKGRKARLKLYCEAKGITMAHCMREMVDACIPEKGSKSNGK